MELERRELLEPVTPTGQYLKSSALSLSILAILEMDVPIDDSQAMSLLEAVFLPINPRFSSIMVQDKKGVKKWKKVQVKLQNHVIIPNVPEGCTQEFYDTWFNEYLSNSAMEELAHNQPMWELHIVKCPTSHAAGIFIFKIHHSIGDGYSLMGALLSCLQRLDNPSLPLTLPSRQPSRSFGPNKRRAGRILYRIPRFFSLVGNTVMDFGWSLLKSTILEDDRTPIRTGEEGVEFRPVTVTTVSLSLDQLKEIKDKLGVTINDVICGIVMFGTRLYMEEGNPKSIASNSTALVLLNTRAIGGYKSVADMIKPNAEMPWGNHFAFLQVSMPKLTAADSSNPLNFVLKAHRLIRKKRNSFTVYLTGWLLEFLRKFKGSEATGRYIHNTLRNSSMVMSNMIGPLERMSLANHPVRGFYFVMTGAPQNLVIGIVSYAEVLRLSITVKKGFIDAAKMKQCIESSFKAMFDAAMKITT